MSPHACPGCGRLFRDFKTGLSFPEVKRMMYDRSEPPYRSKTRKAVLGYWHELKLHMWDMLHGGCIVESPEVPADDYYIDLECAA